MKKQLIKLLLPVALLFVLTGCSDVDLSEASDLVKDISSVASDIATEIEPKEELKKVKVTVDRVVDGDTVNVIMPDGSEESIRLLLIDTPESVHPGKPDQPYGEEASDFAKETLQEGDTVTLEIGNPARDDYDRLLGYIWTEGEIFNQMLIEEGYARVAYVYEPNTKYLDKFVRTEEKAENAGQNIWSIDGYADSGFEEY